MKSCIGFNKKDAASDWLLNKQKYIGTGMKGLPEVQLQN
jgi:hypothetical protein